MPLRSIRLQSTCFAFGHALIATTVLLPIAPLSAQEGPLRPGEAYVTRFSGTVPGAGGPVINTNGTVGSIINVLAPGQPPRGQHWIDEPQRNPVTAGQVGQVFGVVLDDATPPNVYLAATPAFGLHRTLDNAQWMPGLWGQGGGPGTIYRLDAANGYAPRIFAQIMLNGRPNSGPALGNLAYDRTNKQIFVSDLETGMIHRIRAADGADLGVYDHGTAGRTNFLDVGSGNPGNLAPIGFDPNSRARITDCPSKFELSPQCWNFAASGRRVWGVGVHRNPVRNETRLYYAVWSGPAFGNTNWNAASDDDKRNSVWSVRLGPDGGFAGDVRREFIVPDFFNKPEDIARAGYSQPVSDISFAECGPRPIMLVAERGGIRNLGLAAPNPFATPHEARALRYELDTNGAWRAIGRYDVGFYDRKKEGQPFMRANCSGGIAFGLGYDANTWIADPAKVDQFVWATGDSLCSPDGPCNLPGETSPSGQPAATRSAGEQPIALEIGENTQPDDSEVYGLQGLAETAFEEITTAAALAPYPPAGEATLPAGPNQSYLIDTDINVDPSGGLIEEELTRNDATKIGDVAIYQLCTPPASYLLMPPVAVEPPVLIGHPVDVSHALIASHGTTSSHYRFGSHNPYWSHSRFGSHNRYWSHYRTESHNRVWSHNRFGSHTREQSHTRAASHTRTISHWRVGSHDTRLSHVRFGSHNPAVSHTSTGSHNARVSHARLGSHNVALSHARLGSHTTALSHSRTGSHTTALSHARTGSHTTAQSHVRTGSHSTERSHAVTGSHNKQASHNRTGSHTRAQSTTTTHTTAQSQARGHTRAQSQATIHTTAQSQARGHTRAQSLRQ